jgi:cation-transporting ATPase 13A1
VNVCCFDKTGTLTSDEMRLKGVHLCNDTNVASGNDKDGTLLHPEDDEIPWPATPIMVACHSLALAATGGKGRKPSVIGDPLEQAVLKDTGYRLMRNNIVAAVDEERVPEERCKSISILHRFAFSSKLKRMTVLVTEEGGSGKIYALSKGAPETIKELLSPDSIPVDYDDVAFQHMSRGRRVLAMAYRDVGSVRNLKELRDSGRVAVEQGLTFAGFLVLDCPLKPDSKAVISELRKSGHSVVIITGDAILTAAEVARLVGIVRRPSSGGHKTVYRIRRRADVKKKSDVDDPLSLFECVALSNENKNEPLKLAQTNLGTLRQMTKKGEASFCVTGDVLVHLAEAALHIEMSSSRLVHRSTMDEKNLLLSPAAQAALTDLVPLISVFARHAPHQKEAVVAAFNRGGFRTVMVGDGTNDVGALKVRSASTQFEKRTTRS